MKFWFKAYAAAWLTLAVLDGVWLGWLAQDFYETRMRALMAAEVQVLPALLFYMLYPAGLVALVLAPRPLNMQAAALRAALVGAMAYGTYELTNLATLAGWSLALTLVDVVWGTLLSAAAGAAAWHMTRQRTTPF